ncbi:MAG: sulfite exporter TauE/SafE family protein, partial [Gammaproteobacteria bacterium]|nr:sulfite exporter TauE/SafE family protein [Gammaproteobacteria bacterium]
MAVAGLVVGFAVGATGVGGGSLMTPALIMLFGVNPVTAVGTDLMYATISKVFGVVLHGRNRSVDWRIVGWQALGSIPATLATLEFLRDDDYRAQIARLTTLVLAVAVLATAIIILFPQRRLSRADPDRPSAADRGVAGRPALT